MSIMEAAIGGWLRRTTWSAGLKASCFASFVLHLKLSRLVSAAGVVIR